MKLPFTSNDFFGIFKEYNVAVHPAQYVLIALATLCIVAIARRWVNAGKVVLLTLAVLWLWMGVVYHWLYFSAINKAAYLFGGMFVFQGLLLLHQSLFQKHNFAFKNNLTSLVSGVLITYALIIYPVIGHFVGHAYPYSPTFGLPCPTTIFTFGVLLLQCERLPRYLFAVPVIWSLIGFTASFALNVYEDYGLIVSGMAFMTLTILKQRKQRVMIGATTE